MSLDQVNLLNVGLMIGACLAAFVLPFELFLFSYAVLGPLHYLTQISWLHTRGYFTTGKNDYILLVLLCACVGLLKFVATGIDATGWATTIVIVAFASAFAIAFFDSLWVKVATAGGSFVVARLISDLDASRVIFVTFIPTIIHVYLFTAAFMLYGALRSRSATGFASLAIFAACSASFFLFQSPAHPLSSYTVESYELFAPLNVELSAWLGMSPLAGESDVYYSAPGVMLMRFIAFAYTYHFLNWFSKTSVIQWHKIPRPWAIVNVALWIASLGLYAWDYRIGMLTLFTLSFLHVFLEFPLDHQTFVNIGRELVRLPRGAHARTTPR
ncbi:MAG: hypothetical protein E4H03_03900 [Myxococcales bacterium]|nr:MAG: hypothetical protein E4H03_03900 [Myxococcales bacterium]